MIRELALCQGAVPRTPCNLAANEKLWHVGAKGGMRVFLNLNQWPSTMANSGLESLPLADGLLGIGAPNPVAPMALSDRARIIASFADKPRVLETNWSILTKRPQKVVQLAARLNATDIFVWDSTRLSTLTPEQLDALQARGVPPLFINGRMWGPKGTRSDADWIERSIAHPMCKGVFVEGSADALTRPKNVINARLQIARHVVASGKPLYMLMPPGNPAINPGQTHLEKLRAMLSSLRATLGDALDRPGAVTLVPSAYPVDRTTLEFLPERNADGSIANTYSGGVLLLLADRPAEN